MYAQSNQKCYTPILTICLSHYEVNQPSTITLGRRAETSEGSIDPTSEEFLESPGQLLYVTTIRTVRASSILIYSLIQLALSVYVKFSITRKG